MYRPLSKISIAALAGLLSAAALHAQGPAPKRDISGVWTPERRGGGIGANGASNYRADGQHEPPYTPAGLAAFKTQDRKSTRLNSSHTDISRMPSSA